MKKKLKTKKSALKRVKIVKTGFIRHKAYKAHLLRKKSSSQLYRLSANSKVSSVDEKTFFFMIPNF
jgi:ribosomal protein L35